MAGQTAAVELKVLISVVQDSVTTAANNLRGIMNLLKGLDSTTLQNLGGQVKAFQALLKDTQAITQKSQGFKLKPTFVEPDTKPIEDAKKKIILTDPAEIPTTFAPPKDPKLGPKLGPSSPPLGPPPDGEKPKLDLLGASALNAARGVNTLDFAIHRLTFSLKFLAGGFLGMGIVRFIKDLADTAARAQVLQTVLHVVARNAGYMEAEIDAVDKSVQNLGITASSSRQSLVQFLQAGLKLDNAERLARVAQDLAVISGMNSSDTFNRLIVNIQQLDALGLRWMGIVINRNQAEEKYAATLNRTASQLTQKERQEALMNAVMEKALGLQGAYREAMGDVGKQITSLDRLFETLRATLGEGLLPAYLALVSELSRFLEMLTLMARETGANRDAAQALGDAVQQWARLLFNTLLWLAEHRDTIISLVKWYVILKGTMLALKVIDSLALSGVALVTWLVRVREATLLLAAGKAVLVTRASAVGMLLPKLAEGLAKYRVAQLAAAAATAGTTAATTAQTTAFTASGAALAALRTGATGFMSTWAGMATAAAVPLIFTAIMIKKTYDFTTAASTPGTPEYEQYYSVGAASTRGFNAVGDTIDASDIGDFREKLQAQYQDLANVAKQADEIANDPTSTAAARASMERTLQAIRQRVASQQLAFNQALDNASIPQEVRRVQKDMFNRALDAIRPPEIKSEDLQREANIRTIRNINDPTSRLRDELEAQMDKYTETERIFLRISRDTSRPQSELDQATKNLEAEKKRRDDIWKEFDASLERLGASGIHKSRVEAERLLIDRKKAINEQKLFDEKLSQSLTDQFQGKFTFDADGVAQGAGFTKTLSDYETLLTEYERRRQAITERALSIAGGADPTKIPDVLPLDDIFGQLTKGLEGLAPQATTDADMAPLRRVAQTFKEITGNAKLAEEAVGVAALRVRDAKLAFNAPLRAESREAYKLRTDIVIQSANAELAALKLANSEKEALDREAYDNGLQSLDDFYAAKVQRIKDESAAEVRVQEAMLTQLRGQRSQASTGNEQKAFDNQITEATTRITQTLNQAQFQIDQTGMTQRRELKDLDNTMFDLSQRVNEFYDGEVAGIQRVLREYAEKKKSLGQIKEAHEAADEAARLEILQIGLAASDRALQQEVDAKQTLLQVEHERLQIGLANHQLTSEEGMQRSNQLLRQEAAIVEMQITAKKQRLQILIADLREQEAKEREKLLAQGLNDQQATTTIAGRFAGLKETIQGVGNEIEILDSKSRQLISSIDTYGKQMARVFQDSLGRAISDSLKSVKKAGEAWKQMGESIRDFFLDTLSENLAQKFTNYIMNSTSKKKEDGSIEDGTSIFDSFFSLMGLKSQKADGSSPSKALSVNVENWHKFPVSGQRGTLVDYASYAGGVVPGSLNKLFDLGNSVKRAFSTLFSGRSPVTQLYDYAGGGPVSGPGTGTSDSIPAMLSNGEYVVPADKAAKHLSLLENIRNGTIAKYAEGGLVQSIATLIPRRMANGGVVVADGGASTVQTGGGRTNMTVSMDPRDLHMTMREWLEREVIRDRGRR